MRKKVVILAANEGGRMGNHLWNFVSIYAYCLEKGYKIDNYSFFKYKKYFSIPVKNLLVKLFLYGPLSQKMKYRLRRRLERHIRDTKPEKLIESIVPKERTYLPPSSEADPMKDLTKGYFTGWLFRNPEGIEKYRKEIHEYFKPKQYIQNTIKSVIAPLKNQYKHIVGVHIRQTDYALVGTGELLFKPEEVNTMLVDFLETSKLSKEDVVFVICSDGNIEASDFPSLNVHICSGDESEDMFTLAATDRIIGSNSTFGGFAAYYGNIPIVCFSRDSIDWQQFLENKNFEYQNTCTMIQQ